MSVIWRIELLGELRAVRPGEAPVSRFRTQKTAALLARLAYLRERSHPREELMELLWPGCEPDAGRSRLSCELSSLRNQLEPPGVSPGSVLVATRAAIRLEAEATSTDVGELRAALETSSRSLGAPRLQALRAACELYRGELLPGHFQDWVAPERTRLAGAFVSAARALATELSRLGDRAGALDAARRAVAADPLSEEASRELMALLAAAGEPAGALRVLAELEGALEKELGTSPSSATRALAREIERRSSGAAPPPVVPKGAPAPATPRTLAPGTFTLLAAVPASPELRASVLAHSGEEVSAPEGSLAAGFARPTDALACALVHRRRTARMALDTGEGTAPRDRAGALVLAAREGQVLCSEAAAVLLRRNLDPGLRLVDLGIHRLAGAPTPERIFEALGSGDEARSPVNTERVHGASLPLELSRFFGRDAERARLEAALAPGGARLLTITGPGGIGKTRLALEVLPRLAERYPGVLGFVPLADVTQATLIARAIADALHLEPSPAEPLERVVDALARAPSLLVLDNFEQLAAEGAPVIRTLLERASGLTLVVTSRQKVGLEGEQELPLSPLPVPGGEESRESLVQLPSVQMFVDRAQAIRPDFQVTRSNARGLALLVKRLEGIPLALALAAGRTSVLTLDQIGERLSARLDLLEARGKGVPARHRTLRAAIEGSYQLLSPELQRFFARLSVFRGGFTLEAAEDVCEDPDAIDHLADLGECSLVILETPRFRLLETLREFAAEQLSKEERARHARRHAEHHVALAERVGPLLQGAEQKTWFERLGAEMENLRAAFAWSLGEDGEPLFALRGGVALLRLYNETGGLVGEGRDLLAAALERCPEPTLLRARALRAAGSLAWKQRDYAASRRHLEEALPLARAQGDKAAIAGTLNNMGLLARDTGDLTGALKAFGESHVLAKAAGDRTLVASAACNLGTVALNLSDHATARMALEEGTALFRSTGDRGMQVIVLGLLAESWMATGDLARSRSLWVEATEIARGGTEASYAHALSNLGEVDFYIGDLEKARAELEESRGIFGRLGSSWDLAVTQRRLGRVALVSGERDRARGLLDESFATWKKLGSGAGIGWTIRTQGELARVSGELDAARARYEEALAHFRKLRIPIEVPACLEGLGMVAAAEGAPERAARVLAFAAVLRKRHGTPPLGHEVRELAAALDGIRSALGGKFEAAEEAGRKLDEEGAVALARRSG